MTGNVASLVQVMYICTNVHSPLPNTSSISFGQSTCTCVQVLASIQHDKCVHIDFNEIRLYQVTSARVMFPQEDSIHYSCHTYIASFYGETFSLSLDLQNSMCVGLADRKIILKI